MHSRSIKTALAAIVGAGLMIAAPALAAGQIVVHNTNAQGWSTADTRPGGSVSINSNLGAPSGFGSGSLELTTDATTTAKAQLLHAANTPLSAVTQLNYWTKQQAPAGPTADASYQVIVCLTGAPTSTTCPGFTTLVFEPYQNLGNNGNAAVVNGTWQNWDVASGLFWSSRTVTCLNGTVVGSAGGPATYSLAQIKSLCPGAVVAGYGANVGTNNPSYVVAVDGLNFNGTVYNFEPAGNHPSTVGDCKNGNYKDYVNPSFKNQGQCVSYVRSHKNKNNSVTVTNNSHQNSTSGNASSSGNTNGGNASSGNASNTNITNNTVTTK